MAGWISQRLMDRGSIAYELLDFYGLLELKEWGGKWRT